MSDGREAVDILGGTGAGRELRVGVFGPRSVVRLVTDVGTQFTAAGGHRGIRFLNGAHEDPSEAHERYLKLAERIDVAIFPGPLLYDLARAEGYLSRPAIYLSLTGSALLSTLIRGMLESDLDPGRVSIDSLTAEDVAEAYDEIGVDSSRVRVKKYSDPGSVLEFAEFHRSLARSGASTMALTTVLDVEKQLRDEGIPVIRIVPTRATIRTAIETALLLGAGSKLEEQRIAMIAVSMVGGAEMAPAGPSSYWQQDALLSLHRVLLEEARAVDATVVRRTEDLFVVTTTYGGMDVLTSQLRFAPFVGAIRARLGLPVAVGIGVGGTARTAEANALTGAARSRDLAGAFAVFLGERGERMSLPVAPLDVISQDAETTAASSDTLQLDPKAEKTLQRLVAAAVTAEESGAPVLGAEQVAEILGLTIRSARRTLKMLVESGFAWPLPPVKSSGGGRPRQQFRLLPDKIG